MYLVHPGTLRRRRLRRRAVCWAGTRLRATAGRPSEATCWRNSQATAPSGRPSPRTWLRVPPTRSETSLRATRWSSVSLLLTRPAQDQPLNPVVWSSRIPMVNLNFCNIRQHFGRLFSSCKPETNFGKLNSFIYFISRFASWSSKFRPKFNIGKCILSFILSSFETSFGPLSIESI